MSTAKSVMSILVRPLLDKGRAKAVVAELGRDLKPAENIKLFDSGPTNAALASTEKSAKSAGSTFDRLTKSAADSGRRIAGSLKSIAGTGLGKLQSELRGVAGGFDQVEKEAEQARDATGKFTASAGGIGGLVKGAGFAGLALGVGSLAKSMVDGNAVMERYNTQLGVLIGDAGKTEQLMAELKEFGAQTPFEFPELAEASRNLIAFGFSAKETVPELKKVGDISSAVGAPIGEIAELYGKARVQGVLMAEDINQLVGRGIPVIQEFAKQFGVSESEVKKLGSEGKITFEHLQTAFTDLTSEGGKFAGMMEAQAGTFEGLMSTFKDNIGQVVRDLGGPLFDSVKAGLGSLLEIIQSDTVQKAVASVGQAIGGVLNVVMGVLEQVLPAVTALLVPVGEVLVTLLEPLGAILTAVLGPVAAMIQEVAGPIGELLTTAADVVSAVLMPVIQALTPIIALLADILGSLIGTVASLLNAVLPLIQVALLPLTTVIQVLSAVLTAILTPIADLIGKFAEFIQQLLRELQPAIDVGIQLLTEIAELIGDVLAGGLSAVINLVFSLVQEIGGLIAKFLGAKSATDLFSKVLGFVRGVVDKVVGAFRTLRGVVEGIRQVFIVAKNTLKTFIDAVTSLNVGAAIKAFAGFGDKIGKAYKDGFEKGSAGGGPSLIGGLLNSIATGATTAAQNGANAAEEVATTTANSGANSAEKNAKNNAERLKKLREQLDEEVEKASAEKKVDLIEDARKQELADLAKTFEERKAQAKEKYKDLGENDATLQKLLTLQEEQFARDREKLFKKLHEDGLKANTDAFKAGLQAEIDIIRSQMELVTGEDAKSVTRRGELRRQELEKQRDLELGLLARQTPEMKAAFAELDRQLLEEKISPEQYEAKITELVTTAIESATEGSDIDLAAKSFGLKIESSIQQASKEAREAYYNDVEASIRRRTTDLGALEYKLRLLDLRKQYDAELAAAGENEALKKKATREFLAERHDLEQAYLIERNDAVAASFAFEAGLRKAFNQEVDDEQRKRTEEEIDRLESDGDRLEEWYKEGRISHAEYQAELVELTNERIEKQNELERGHVDLVKTLGAGLVEASKQFEEQKAKQVEETTNRLLEMSKAGQVETAEFGQAQLELLKQYGVQTSARLAGAFGDMLAQGEVSLAALGNVVLSSLFDLVQKEILILTPTIYAKAFAMLGPILGAVAATGALALVQGGLSLAKSNLKFHEGGVDVGEGPRGREFDAKLLTGESVMTVDVTRRERPLLTHLLEGGTSEQYFVNRFGRLVEDRVAREQMTELNSRMQENTVELRNVADRVEKVAKAQEKVAKRFSSESHIRHTFDEVELDGRTLKIAIDKSREDDLSF